MGRVVIRHTEDVQYEDFPQLAGMSAVGAIRTKAVVTEAGRPLRVWQHELQAGDEITWNVPAAGHVFYVSSGSVVCGTATIESEEAVIVEHNSRGRIAAGANGARIVHFHQADTYQMPSAKPGGHVHVVGKDGIFKGFVSKNHHTFTFFAEGSCPNCDLWLHKSEFGAPRPQNNPHFHTTDEIIFVVKGEMLVGNRTLTPGTALAIDARTVYGFGVGEHGLAFINFRAEESYSVMMSREGPLNEPRNERESLKARAERALSGSVSV